MQQAIIKEQPNTQSKQLNMILKTQNVVNSALGSKFELQFKIMYYFGIEWIYWLQACNHTNIIHITLTKHKLNIHVIKTN